MKGYTLRLGTKPAIPLRRIARHMFLRATGKSLLARGSESAPVARLRYTRRMARFRTISESRNVKAGTKPDRAQISKH
jgi:hypothetical protein